VGITYDPANFLANGKINPIDALKVIAPYVKHIHVKDIDDDSNFVKVGAGVTPWSDIVNYMKDIGYTGDYSVEFEGPQYNEEDRELGLKQSLEAIEEILA
jgi:sugar phosphate isomerase/epimerase